MKYTRVMHLVSIIALVHLSCAAAQSADQSLWLLAEGSDENIIISVLDVKNGAPVYFAISFGSDNFIVWDDHAEGVDFRLNNITIAIDLAPVSIWWARSLYGHSVSLNRNRVPITVDAADHGFHVFEKGKVRDRFILSENIKDIASLPHSLSSLKSTTIESLRKLGSDEKKEIIP